jgi:hypothetical protein
LPFTTTAWRVSDLRTIFRNALSGQA